MKNILDRIRERINDPTRVTSMSKRSPTHDPIPPPATPEAVATAEERIGFRFPALLRTIYTEIANGGIGPGYGLIGVRDTSYHRGWMYANHDIDDPDIADTFLDIASFAYWPTRFVPICDWGCLHSSAIDFSNPDCRVVFDALDHDFRLHAPSFEAWIEDWLADNNLWEQGWASKQIPLAAGNITEESASD